MLCLMFKSSENDGKTIENFALHGKSSLVENSLKFQVNAPGIPRFIFHFPDTWNNDLLSSS